MRRGRKSLFNPKLKMSKEEEASFIFEGLYTAYLKARKGKRAKVEVWKFEANLMLNLRELMYEILERKYRPSPGIAFVSHEPVIREIFAGPFRDRVVHHFLCDMNMAKFEEGFIETSTSCRVGKGTLYGVKKLEESIRQVSENYTKEAYAGRFDIKGFFMSMSRELLYKEVLVGLNKFYPEGGTEYEICKFLWSRIIFDDPVRGVHKKGGRAEWKEVPRSKSLFGQKKGRGIVIGNLTSQLLSNIFMNKFDHYVVDFLGYEHYGRYVDDFYLIVLKKDLKKMTRDLKLIEDFLSGMGLTLHPEKKTIQEVRKGVKFLGYRVFGHGRLASKRVRKNMLRAMILSMEGVDMTETLQSYYGYMKHCKSEKFLKELTIKASKCVEYRKLLSENRRKN